MQILDFRSSAFHLAEFFLNQKSFERNPFLHLKCFASSLSLGSKIVNHQSKIPMFIAPQNTDLLLQEAEKETLYINLIVQMNKDFNLANEAVDFPLSLSPDELKIQLHEKIYRLIQYKFAEYLNLLYIIDVSEEEIKKLDGSDLVVLAEQVAFLILKREWQKVWFRNKYK
jgi:hypothetical protein